jgi:hypothetical protein
MEVAHVLLRATRHVGLVERIPLRELPAFHHRAAVGMGAPLGK